MQTLKNFILFALLMLKLSVAISASRGLILTEANPAVDMVQGEFRALVIGNNSYRDQAGQWTPLQTAASDASAISALLKISYGFSDVTTLIDAGRSDVLKALNELESRTRKNDSVLVYYAGHGYLDDSSSRGYWIPVDANSDDPASYLRNSTIRDEVSIIAAKARHTLLISDSCFSGSLLRRGGSPKLPDKPSERYYKKVAAKKSVQIMTAGGQEYVDDNYRESGHSPFTYFLLNELKHNDKKLLTASEVSSNVIKAVANNVRQLPEQGVLHGAGDELGEFIFVRVKLDVDVEGVPRDKVRVIVDVNNGQSFIPANKSTPVQDEKRQPVLPLPTL